MPNSPPSCNEEHTTIVAVPNLCWEDSGIEEQNQSQTRVLDTSLHCERTHITLWQLAKATGEVARHQSAGIVEHHDEEYVEDVIHKKLEILRERHSYHTDKEQD